MVNQLRVVIVDDETIEVAGRTVGEQAELTTLFVAAFEQDPSMLLVMVPRSTELFKGIGKVIYASQRAGVPVDHLRFSDVDGELLSLDALRARHAS